MQSVISYPWGGTKNPRIANGLVDIDWSKTVKGFAAKIKNMSDRKSHAIEDGMAIARSFLGEDYSYVKQKGTETGNEVTSIREVPDFDINDETKTGTEVTDDKTMDV